MTHLSLINYFSIPFDGSLTACPFSQNKSISLTSYDNSSSIDISFIISSFSKYQILIILWYTRIFIPCTLCTCILLSVKKGWANVSEILLSTYATSAAFVHYWHAILYRDRSFLMLLGAHAEIPCVNRFGNSGNLSSLPPRKSTVLVFSSFFWKQLWGTDLPHPMYLNT